MIYTDSDIITLIMLITLIACGWVSVITFIAGKIETPTKRKFWTYKAWNNGKEKV
jgi:hypothetical protein